MDKKYAVVLYFNICPLVVACGRFLARDHGRVCGNAVIVGLVSRISRERKESFQRGGSVFLVVRGVVHGADSRDRFFRFRLEIVVRRVGGDVVCLCPEHGIEDRVFRRVVCCRHISNVMVFRTIARVVAVVSLFVPGDGRVREPAILAVFLAIACLAGVVGFYREGKLYSRCFRGVGIVLLLVGLVFLGSRAAWVGWGMGIAWIVLTGREWGVTRLLAVVRGKYRAGSIILLLFAGGLFAGVIYILYLLHPESVQGRFLIWRVAGTMLRDAPWFGCGSFSAAYMPAQGAWFEAHPDSPFVSVAGNNEYAFNEFLRWRVKRELSGCFFSWDWWRCVCILPREGTGFPVLQGAFWS